MISISSKAQDNCGSAFNLCGSSQAANRTTNGATFNASDPALSCGDNTVNNSVWFTVLGSDVGGFCTVTVSKIDSVTGLDMEIYTGACGSLVSIGQCAHGDSTSPGKTMSITFPVAIATTYYIMVDGVNGNRELFDIIATSPDTAIISRPFASVTPSSLDGCNPATFIFDGNVGFYGGANPTLEWRIDLNPYLPAASPDTTITFTVAANNSITLQACNQQCGCKSETQSVTTNELQTSIAISPPNTCIGTSTTFDGSAVMAPNPADPTNVSSWEWDFGDPASGVLNTASGQSVNHIFVGTPPFNVRLIVQGDCGPDTSFQNINPPPAPTVTINGPVEECEGVDINLTSSTTNTTAPVTYAWSGASTFSCTSCSSTILDSLASGATYTVTLSITDANSCTADTTLDISINELPTIFAGGIITVCASDSAQLNAVAANGLPPYDYLWAPSAGLNSSTIANPYTFNTNGTSYCVTATDSKGCTSTPDCVTLNQFPIPVVSPSSANLCATQLPLQNTFSVMGGGAGSTYEWGMSPSYSTITGAAVDSSDITADFPPVPATYDFTVIVADGVTGCIDTVPTSFSVTAGLSMSVSGPTNICNGDTVTLSVTGADTYSWSASPSYTFGNSTDSIQNVYPLANTVFTITGTTPTCTQTITHTLNVGAIPDAYVDTIPAFCGCATVTLNGSGSTAGMVYLWTSSSGSLIADSSNQVTTAQVCGSDALTLLVTDTTSGCFSDSTVNTFLRPNPAAQITVTPDLICDGVSTMISLDGNGSDTASTTFLWSSSDPFVIINDTTSKDTTSATVSTATIFFLTVTDALGCDSTVSDTVNIFPPPNLNANMPFICTTDPLIESTLSILGASPGSTYDWDSIPACAVPSSLANTVSSQLFDLAACGVGVHNFQVTVSDAISGCTTTVSQTVSIVNGVTLTVSPDTSFCEGVTDTLFASGANTFLWSTGSTTDTIILTGLTAALSPYTFIVIGYIGSCSDTDTIIVTVNPVPMTSPISGPTSVCELDPNPSQYSVSPPSANTYTWDLEGGVILVGSSNDVFVQWDSVGLDSIWVIETTAFGCIGPRQSLNVIVNSKPVPPIVAGPDTVCNDEIATYFVNANAGSIYTWEIGGGIFLTGPTGTVNTFQWTATGNDSLKVVEQSSAGCVGDSATYYVFVNPRPGAVTATGNLLVCDNLQEVYSVSANPGSIYTWDIVTAVSDSVNVATDSLTVTWGNSGTGHIYVFETNSFGCNSDTLDLTVSISDHPQIFIPVTSANICNNPYQIVSSVTATGIRWTTDGGGTFNDTTIASPVYTPAVSDVGTFTLTLIASSTPCNDTTGTITLNISPSPIVNITGPTSPICFGTADTLIATGGGTYIWTPGGIPFDTIGVRPLVTTTYTVAVTNTFNCTTVDTFTVNIIPPGTPDAGSDIILCSGDTASLIGSQQNATGVEWSSPGDGTFIPDTTSLSVSYIPGTLDTSAGFTQIILTTTGGCFNLSDTMEIDIELQPYIEAGNDTTLPSSPAANATLPLSPNSFNVSGVTWTTSGTGTFNPTDTSINAVYVPSSSDLELDSIIIIVTTIGSCIPVTDSIIVDFAPFMIPNVFSPYPASPGQNDFFVIRYLTPNCKLKVWDRWGSLVYTSDYYQNDWDANGLKADVYYYLVTSEDKQYKGWVQVFKDE